MAGKESENLLGDIHKIEKDIHFYKTELLLERPSEYIYEVRKLLVKAEDKKRHLMFEVKEAQHRESIAEKESKKTKNK